MTKKHIFRAVIEAADGGGAFVIVPFDVEKTFGKKRVKVWFEGVEYHGSLVRMGGPQHILGVRKDIRVQIGKSVGDEIEVVLEEDLAPRVVVVPDDMRKALAAEVGLEERFRKLSYSHQKEYIQSIQEAKREETRQRRIQYMIEALKKK